MNWAEIMSSWNKSTLKISPMAAIFQILLLASGLDSVPLGGKQRSASSVISQGRFLTVPNLYFICWLLINLVLFSAPKFWCREQRRPPSIALSCPVLQSCFEIDNEIYFLITSRFTNPLPRYLREEIEYRKVSLTLNIFAWRSGRSVCNCSWTTSMTDV